MPGYGTAASEGLSTSAQSAPLKKARDPLEQLSVSPGRPSPDSKSFDFPRRRVRGVHRVLILTWISAGALEVGRPSLRRLGQPVGCSAQEFGTSD